MRCCLPGAGFGLCVQRFCVLAFCVLRFVFCVRVENVGFRISDLGFGLRVETCDAAFQVLVRRSIVCRCSGLST